MMPLLSKYRSLKNCLTCISALLALACALASPLSAAVGENETALEEAIIARSEGEFETATIVLKNLLQKIPEDLPARLLLGETYLDTGNAISAQKEIETARSLGADAQQVRILLGRALLMQSSFEMALAEVGETQSGIAEPASLVMIRASAMAGLGRYEEATSVFHQVLEIDPQSNNALTSLALIAMEQGDWPLAHTHLDAALAIDPVFSPAWIARGQLARRQGDMEAAVTAYSTILDLDPAAMQARILRTSLFMDMGRYDDALKDIDAALEEAPDTPQLLHLKAETLGRLGDTDAAMEYMERAGKLLNGADQESLASFPTMLRLAGIVNGSLYQDIEARDFFRAYLATFPNDPLALKWMATLSLRLGTPQDAIPYLTTVLAQDADEIAGLNLMGIAHVRLRQFEKALPYFERAAQLTPESAEQIARIGSVHLSSGNVDEAIDALADAIEKDPDSLSSITLLILAYIQSDDTQGAQKALATAQANWPETPMARLLAATIDLAAGDAAAARDNLNAAIDIDPGFLPAQLTLASIATILGEFDVAQGHYARILKDAPENMAAIQGMAIIAQDQNELDEAVSWHQRALAASPGDPGPTAALVAIESSRGNATQAEKLATDFLLTSPNSTPVLAAYTDFLVAEGRTDEAIDRLGTAIVESPTQPQLRLVLAKAHIDSGYPKQAMEALEVAIKDFEGNIGLYQRLVRVALDNADLARAGRAADAFTALRPQDPQAAVLKGDVLMHARDYEQAFGLFDGVAKTNPSGDILVGLMKASLPLGRGQQILPILADWVENHPGDAEAKSILAGASQFLGDVHAAISLYEELQVQMPRQASLLNNLAWMYQSTGNSKALETARQAYGLSPDNANIADTYGWILVQSGDAQTALPLLRAARAKNASNPIIQFHTGIALYELGRNREAERELEAVLAQSQPFEGYEYAQEVLSTIQTAQNAGN